MANPLLTRQSSTESHTGWGGVTEICVAFPALVWAVIFTILLVAAVAIFALVVIASRWPYRECLRAASWRRSTSFGVRYSRSRRSAFDGRRGVTVRFTMVEGSRAVRGFFTGNAPYGNGTFRITAILRRVINFSP